MSDQSLLPVFACRDQIVATLMQSHRMVVSAPPGSGKSTCIPRFFLDEAAAVRGSIIVLQPRRLAARSLAAYCSRMIGETCGEQIGYRVRFESRVGPSTRLVFQTYGVFIRQLFDNPLAKGIGIVVCDEFHERTLEMDLVLAWIAALQRRTGDAPALMVMSATLEGEPLVRFLDHAPLIDIPARVFPVDVTHQPAKSFETPEQQALRALQGVIGPAMDGSVLIFMPGVGEIQATARLAEPVCRRYGVPVFELQGRLSLNEQMAVMDASASRPCVIIATNVAETSLTIPGVTCVIDSGLERRAAFDPNRDRNTLYRGLISKQSAVQRAGRAGRLSPGRCVRLWSREAERGMPDTLPPEIVRLDLSWLALAALGLEHRSGLRAGAPMVLPWLTNPERLRWQHAVDLLAAIDAVAARGDTLMLTDLGNRLVDVPTDPLPAAILILSEQQGVTLMSCALIALWENQDSSGPGVSADLFESACTLIKSPDDRGFSRDVLRSFDALCSRFDSSGLSIERRAVVGPGAGSLLLGEILRTTAMCWMKPLQHRLAVREESGSRYLFADGRAGTLRLSASLESEQPEALLVLTILETTGAKQGRRNLIVQYIPVKTAWIAEVFKDRLSTDTMCRWDDQRRAVVAERRTHFGGLVLARESAPGADMDADATADLLVERLMSGATTLIDDETQQLAYRIRCVSAAFPDDGFPRLVDDDWRLIYHDMVRGLSTEREVERLSLAKAIREYIGVALTRRLDQLAPVRILLRSGKTARITYFENAPPELNARIGDLVGTTGGFSICNGRVEGIFNILAPNHRTVQKTATMSGFWQGVYPQIKNELKRKYPKHPWP